MEEIWKDVKGYEGHYTISNLGNLRSHKRNIINLMCPAPTNQGYLRVKLTTNGISTTLSMHRLVAEAFIDNPENKRCVNHINGIKDDNRLENLEWSTDSENIKHAFDILGRQNTMKKKVLQYDRLHNLIKEWDSIEYAANNLVIHRSSITSCCVGRRKSAGGFIWKFP